MMFNSIYSRSAARVAACWLALTAIPAARADFEVQQNVAFTTKGQSPYGPGAAFQILEPGLNILKQPLLLNAGPAIKINAWDAFLGGLLPSDLLPNIFSLEAGFGAHGTNNLDLGYYVAGGRLDVTYPASSNLNFRTEAAEKRVIANETYSIGAQFLPGVNQRTIPSEFWTTLGPGGPELWLSKKVTGEGGFTFQTGQPPPSISNPSFVVHSPYASAWLDSRIDLRVGAYAKITALGGLIDEGVDFTFGASVGDRIAEIDPSGLYVAGAKVSDVSLTDPIPISVPIQGGSAKLQLPRLGLASDSQQGGVVRGFDKQPILSVQGNLEKLIPGVGQFLEGSVGPFGYKLVTVTGGPVVSLYQDMKFDAKPEVRLRFSEPVLVKGTQMGDVVVSNPSGQLLPTTLAQMPVQGGALTWQPMISNSDQVVISPTYILKNDFTTKVGLDLSVEGRVEALEVTHPFGSTGPLIEAGFSESLLSHDLFNKTFTVPINDVVAARVTIPKTNFNLLTGEDLKFSQFFFTPDQPPGAVKYNIEFTRRLADGSTRTYLAPGVVGQQTFHPNGLPDPGEGNETYGTFAANDPIVITDLVTGEQFDLGRHILTGTYDVSSLLPPDSPNYSPQPNPLLPDFVPPVFANLVSASPEIPINTSVDPYLKGYNDLAIDPTKFVKTGTPRVTDRRLGGSSQVIVSTGDPVPTADGTFTKLTESPPSIDRQGQVLFAGRGVTFDGAGDIKGVYRGDGVNKIQIGDNVIGFGESVTFQANDEGQIAVANSDGIFRGGPGSIVKIADGQGPPPEGNGQVFDWFLDAINNAGQVAVQGYILADQPANPFRPYEFGVYRGDENGLLKIVREGDHLPGLSGPVIFIGNSALSDNGDVAFRAATASFADGLYVSNGGTPTPIAISGTAAPDGHVFAGFVNNLSINATGEVAFAASLQATGGSALTAVYKWKADELTEIAVQGVTPGPDGSNLHFVSSPMINGSGDVAFAETNGVYLSDGDQLERLAYNGQPLPDGSGAIISEGFGAPRLNERGQVAFQADVFVDVEQNYRNSIFVHDGERLVEVIRTGQPLAGGIVKNVSLADMNDRMQIVYYAELADNRQVVARFDPALYWKAPGSGQWEADGNWSLGIDPAAPYDAFIIAPQPLTVMGPAVDSAVRSLVLGGDHTAEAVLDLVDGTTLSIAEGARIRASGVLRGQGAIDGDVMNEGGTVSPGNSPGMLHIEGDYLQGPIGKLALEIAGPNAGSEYDVLDVTGDVVLAGQVEISFLAGYAPAPGTRFNFIAYDGAFDASQAEFLVTGAPAGSQFTAFAAGGVFGLAAVPEPRGCALAMIAVCAIWGRRRSAHDGSSGLVA